VSQNTGLVSQNTGLASDIAICLCICCVSSCLDKTLVSARVHQISYRHILDCHWLDDCLELSSLPDKFDVAGGRQSPQRVVATLDGQDQTWRRVRSALRASIVLIRSPSGLARAVLIGTSRVKQHRARFVAII